MTVCVFGAKKSNDYDSGLIIYFKTQFVGGFDTVTDYSMFLSHKYSQHRVHVMTRQ